MKTFAHIHLASAHSLNQAIEIDSQKPFDWKNLSNYALLRLLPIAVTIAVLSVASTALAVPIRRGNSGSEVANVQRCLRQLGYFKGSVTGFYGSVTQNAVTRFERANSLPADGVVDATTQSRLQAQCQPSRPINNTSAILRLGNRGPAVTTLQENLRRLGYFDSQPTGYFGSVTRQGVIRLQQDNRLVADGIVGSRTRNAIDVKLGQIQNPGGTGGDSDPFPSNLNQGDRGSEVRLLQANLQRLGYFKGRPTGYFGPVTKEAVSRFQRDFGLNVTGVADARTLSNITRAVARRNNGNDTASRRELSIGDRGRDVTQLQQRLRDLGYFRSTPTGYYGPVTRDAVIRFQRDRGLVANGITNARTWDALGFDIAAKNRYLVVVPVRNANTLYEVRRFVPDAFESESRLGSYVNAGAFRERANAENRSAVLRRNGLDARVHYV
ncbi:MAG: peptidoglycan-binding protein [Nostocaceae cyanobacterium]|nr:peptidoglycan-binding protein [Nostocaceae cyanobacterium]